jgi:hypothetical protein
MKIIWKKIVRMAKFGRADTVYPSMTGT